MYAAVEVWDSYWPGIRKEKLNMREVDNKISLHVESDLESKISEDVTGDITTLQSYERADDLCLQVSTTPFKYHWLLNKRCVYGGAQSRKLASDLGILPLTVACTTITQDSKLLIGVRNPNQFQVSTGVYTAAPGGYVRPGSSIFTTASDEFCEEIGCSEDAIKSLCATGLLFSDYSNRGFTVPMLLESCLTAAEIEKRFESRADKELDKIKWIELAPGSISAFLSENLRGFSNNGLGATLANLRWLLGAEWYETQKLGVQKYFRIDEFNYKQINNVRSIVLERFTSHK